MNESSSAGNGARVTTECAVEAISRVLEQRRGEVGPVTAETSLEELDIDSVELTEIFILIEDLTGCQVVTRDLPELTTVADFARLDCL